MQMWLYLSRILHCNTEGFGSGKASSKMQMWLYFPRIWRCSIEEFGSDKAKIRKCRCDYIFHEFGVAAPKDSVRTKQNRLEDADVIIFVVIFLTNLALQHRRIRFGQSRIGSKNQRYREM